MSSKVVQQQIMDSTTTKVNRSAGVAKQTSCLARSNGDEIAVDTATRTANDDSGGSDDDDFIFRDSAYKEAKRQVSLMMEAFTNDRAQRVEEQKVALEKEIDLLVQDEVKNDSKLLLASNKQEQLYEDEQKAELEDEEMEKALLSILKARGMREKREEFRRRATRDPLANKRSLASSSLPGTVKLKRASPDSGSDSLDHKRQKTSVATDKPRRPTVPTSESGQSTAANKTKFGKLVPKSTNTNIRGRIDSKKLIETSKQPIKPSKADGSFNPQSVKKPVALSTAISRATKPEVRTIQSTKADVAVTSTTPTRPRKQKPVPKPRPLMSSLGVPYPSKEIARMAKERQLGTIRVVGGAKSSRS